VDGPRGFIGYAPSSGQWPPSERPPEREHPPAPPSPFEEREGLAPVPAGYANDRVVALAKDPHTLWVYWDLNPETVQRGRGGMAAPVAALRLHRNGVEARRFEVMLESRNFYLNGLEPGQVYRVEVCWISGAEVRIIKSSREVRLPPAGPSPRIADRFVHVPWDLSLRELDLASLEVKAPEGPDRRTELAGPEPAGYPTPSSSPSR
jgi:hypothetical protein